MKYWLICLFACLITNASLNAQIIRSYGAKIAYTSANEEYTTKYGKADFDRRSGFNAAAFIEWLDVPFVSVVTQLEYAQRGETWEVSPRLLNGEPLGTETFWTRTDYLSVPLMGKLRLPIGLFSPFIEAGPRIDIFLGYDNNYSWNDSFHAAFKKVNIGASVGLGSELHAPLLPVTLSLEARYNLDLTDSYSTEYVKIRNNSFDVWLGVGF